MKRFALFLPVLAIVALAACTEGSTTVVNSEDPTVGVIVEGRGEVTGTPDTAFISLGVEVVRPTVAEAREEAAVAAAAVIDSAKANGIDDPDIQTNNFAIYPVYDYRNNTPIITGYSVSNAVTVKVRDLDSLSAVIDDAAAAGGDLVRINSIRFEIADNAALLEQAREAAMNDARAKAQQLASLGEVNLGKPVSISETQSSAPPPEIFSAAAMQAADRSTPIQPGTGSVTVLLTVRWAIDD